MADLIAVIVVRYSSLKGLIANRFQRVCHGRPTADGWSPNTRGPNTAGKWPPTVDASLCLTISCWPIRVPGWEIDLAGRLSAGGPLLGPLELVETEDGELAGNHPRQRMQGMGNPFLIGHYRDSLEGRMMRQDSAEGEL